MSSTVFPRDLVGAARASLADVLTLALVLRHLVSCATKATSCLRLNVATVALDKLGAITTNDSFLAHGHMLLHECVLDDISALSALDVSHVFVADAPVVIKVEDADQGGANGAFNAPVLAIGTIVALQVAEFDRNFAVYIQAHEREILEYLGDVSREGSTSDVHVAALGARVWVILCLLELVEAYRTHRCLALFAASRVRREDVTAEAALHHPHVLL